MWPDSPFAEPRGSFLRPLLVPTSGPDSTPTQTVTINCSWLLYIRGALQQLLLQSTWDTDDPALLLQAQQWAFQLIDMFPECGSAIAFACPYDMTLSDNGFTQMDYCFTDWSPCMLSHYVVGVGWVDDPYTAASVPGIYFRRAAAQFNFPATTITRVDMQYDFRSRGFSIPYDSTAIHLELAGTIVGSIVISSDGDPDGDNKHLVWTGSVTADRIIVAVADQAYTSPGGAVPGYAHITKVTLNGNGAPLC